MNAPDRRSDRARPSTRRAPSRLGPDQRADDPELRRIARVVERLLRAGAPPALIRLVESTEVRRLRSEHIKAQGAATILDQQLVAHLIYPEERGTSKRRA
ncbi:MAG: hypothetical protein U1F43_20590 [Myxococcota bacterium]